MMDQAVREIYPFLFWKYFDEFGFDLIRLRFRRQSEKSSDPFHVSIDDDPGGKSETGSENDVGGFAADAGEGDFAELSEFVRAGAQLAFDEFEGMRTHAQG